MHGEHAEQANTHAHRDREHRRRHPRLPEHVVHRERWDEAGAFTGAIGVAIAHAHRTSGARDFRHDAVAQTHRTAGPFDTANHTQGGGQHVAVEIRDQHRHTVGAHGQLDLTGELTHDLVLVERARERGPGLL